MAIKKLSIEIGGQSRELSFGKVSFLEYAGEVWDGDPMELLAGTANPKKLYKVILAYVYAGLKCGGSDATAEKVNEWVKDLDFDVAAEVLAIARLALAGKRDPEGEAVAQTQSVDQGSEASPGVS